MLNDSQVAKEQVLLLDVGGYLANVRRLHGVVVDGQSGVDVQDAGSAIRQQVQESRLASTATGNMIYVCIHTPT